MDKTKFYKIVDNGCGTGAQIITLTKTLKGEIIAVDLFREFLEKLEENISAEEMLTSITPVVASMDNLPFE